jgi:hypothetical protein
VPGLRQGRDGDVGDVLGVDERLPHAVHGQRDLPREHLLQQEALAEVLAEPAAPHDRPLGARLPHGPLRALGLFLPAAG